MRIIGWTILGLVSLGCKGPGLEACKAACANVHSVVAASVGTVEAEQEPDLEGCIRTCATQDVVYIDCLTTARTTKELRECHGESDG